jgi:hypothetical protein
MCKAPSSDLPVDVAAKKLKPANVHGTRGRTFGYFSTLAMPSAFAAHACNMPRSCLTLLEYGHSPRQLD